ncbi:methyltransferase domain-containing protein [Halomarina halobia]|uniref:tRNA (guanine(10)-N(2))-dimethyltransferase n=1 Tax=Halomarina halobia TaxID=3033386 RepID=A0ABD6AA47_9EURY|nr:methyltransferase domain-containing protein [Halomarina sp. PSR21]
MYLLELVGEDDPFAACEAESACSDVRPLAPGLVTARGVTERVASLAYTRRVSALLGTTDADVAAARALLDAAGVDREGTVAVRARDVRGTTGVDARRAERELGSVLVERGFAVDLEDPDHELRACFSDGTCALGWLEVETARDFGERRPTDRPFFQPGSMDAMLARALVNVAGARPGARVLDPMCGTGGVLVEAGLVGAAVVGLDAQRKMVRGARENLAHFLGPDRTETLRGDATRLPLCDDSVDAVVFDAPYGRQSKIVGGLADLVGDALAEARRVAPRCVLVADRPWREAAEAAGWTVERAFERRVHRSLDRHVLVLG